MKQFQLGEYLKQKGMYSSLENANNNDPKWSVKAFNFVLEFLNIVGNQEFMAEDIREYASLKGLSQPPSKRAWGSIIVKAKKNQLITFVRYSQVHNAKAHMANAVVWRKS